MPDGEHARTGRMLSALHSMAGAEALGTGRERTRDGYLALLRKAGFSHTQVIGTPYGLSIIDASPGPAGPPGEAW
jgi:hypothetical protein